MDFEKLASQILEELESIGKTYSEFQSKTKLSCPPGCGKCCQNPEIACSPYELLPLAMDLLKRDLAEEYLKKCKEDTTGICIMQTIHDGKLGLGVCTDYQYRPLICRAFGVAGRKNRLDQIDLSICKTLKDLNLGDDLNVESLAVPVKEIPLIGHSKSKLEAIDPVLLMPQYNINKALEIILEKVLLWNSYSH
jgi:Fe-S-cluster containining protein